MDLTALSPEQFHHLCARLLSSAGFGLLTLPPKAHDLGIDLYVCGRGESLFAVQIKHKIRRVVTGIQLRQTLKGLQDSVKLLGATGAILIIPAVLPQQVRSLLKTAPDTEIWDHLKLVQVISQDHNIEIEVEAMLRAQNTVLVSPRVDRRALELARRLTDHPAGPAQWREFEELCIEVLNYCFIPPLKVPKIQSRSDDGLDRRDAIYPIGRGNGFWDTLRGESRSRFVVAEFKNGDSVPTQKEVESLQQYLWPQAMRSFGLLCARKGPSDSALLARRRAWVENEKLIVILSDSDLLEAINLRAAGGDASEIIDAQLEEFFATLSP